MAEHSKPVAGIDTGKDHLDLALHDRHWFNHRRLLEPIGNVPPAEPEARYFAQIEEQALAA